MNARYSYDDERRARLTGSIFCETYFVVDTIKKKERVSKVIDFCQRERRKLIFDTFMVQK